MRHRAHRRQMKTKTILLTEAQVRSLMDWKTAVRIAEELLREQGRGHVLVPAELLVRLCDRGLDSYLSAMPAYLEHLGIAGTKWGGGYGHNAKAGYLPYMMQVAILNSPITGEIHAIMGSTWLTTAKTGSETALCGKFLAKNDDLIVVVVGAGLQGRASVGCWLALDQLGDISIRQLRVVDLDRKKSLAVAVEAREEHPAKSIVVVDTVEEALEGAHAVITATTATAPIVDIAWLRNDVLVASVGSHIELDPRVPLAADKLVVDSWAQSGHRGSLSGLIEQGKITRDQIHGELPEIIAGNLPGRESSDNMIVAGLQGLASVDLAIGWQIFKRAEHKGIGTFFSFL
jgi:ornithine cyclodeaminase/alanine dehydrogenase-like protein (mu-crystallin family)